MSDWQSILDRISNQMVLRIVSCCQIASKLVSHYKIITQARARHILKEAGHRYSNDSILQSELRVLKTLDYNVSVLTPIVYVETLLEILGYNLKNCRVKIYYGVCIKLIDLFSIKRQTVYDTLYSITSRKSFCSQLQRKRFMSVECDSMLLAAATVAASVYIVDQDKADQITDELGKTTRLVTDDILDFAAILVQLVIGDDDDELSDSGSYTPRDNNKHQ
ncbi:cyclin N-terminal domain-containing protein 1-like [Tubulanus polymorphus]|uniref:cyclin N-terminal domain-containing protein 1-like n=1 Tax=Tubulanus polymorphus TaxID=672921 RepID=UPI003DA3EA31